MRWFNVLFIIPMLIIASCNSKNPVSNYEATDEEAIYNVVLIDNIRLSEIVAFPETVPDTASFIANPVDGQPLFWHDLDTLSESFNVSISAQPVSSPIGDVYEATVVYTIIWYGTFETLNYNSSADSLERYSRSFQVTGKRTARCQRWGQTSLRRGWRLTEIGGATINAGTGQGFLQDLVYHCDSNDDSLFNGAIVETADIPRFDTDEEVTLTFDIGSDNDLAYIFIPDGNLGYTLATPEPVGDSYKVTMTMPSIDDIYGQFRFYVVNAGQFTGSYKARGYSYGYRMR